MAKPKLALYWAASCGGCDIAVLDIEENILDVAEFFDIVFWPCATDFKYSDVEAMPDRNIDICLFNGAIRTSENERLALLLRRKSKVMVAFGSCAHEGSIPGLANLTTREEIFRTAYSETPTTHNPGGVMPQMHTRLNGIELEIPEFWDSVKTLDQIVKVDYYIPGCPPQSTQVWAVLKLIMTGATLPPPGSVIGAGEKTCCDECGRERKEKKIKHFHRPHEIEADPETCLLDQGIICMGPATRSGCGALCPAANSPCRGCYGPAPNAVDQGAKMMSALSSVIDATDPAEVERIIGQIVDPVGTLYRFSLPHSLLRRARP
jgi:F420-non-reducing hydrogenase small subunit